MIRTWKTLPMLFVLSAIACPLTPMPLFAQDEKQPAKVEGLDKLQEAIKALEKKLDQLKTSSLDKDAVAEAVGAELQKLQDGALTPLKNEITALRAEQKKAREDQQAAFNLLASKIEALQNKTGPAVDKAYMDEMKQSMKNIQDTVAKLGSISPRIALSSPSNEAPIPKTGRVLVTNYYTTPLVFSINGKDYTVQPGTVLTLAEMPAGPINYALVDSYGIFERQAVTLLAGKTLFVTVGR